MGKSSIPEGRMGAKPKIPRPPTTNEKLFVERFWNNGGDLVDAVNYAGLAPAGFLDADRARKGRQLLASKPVAFYLRRLRELHKAQVRASEGGVSGGAAEGEAPVNQGDSASGDGVEKSAGGATKNQKMGAFRPGGLESRSPESYLPRHTSTHIDVDAVLPPGAAAVLREMAAEADAKLPRIATPDEIKVFLSDVMRGRDKSFGDARIRLRACELLMRNLGMLVEAQVVANVTPNQSMSPAERQAELERLEGYLAAVRAVALPKPVDAELAE